MGRFQQQAQFMGKWSRFDWLRWSVGNIRKQHGPWMFKWVYISKEQCKKYGFYLFYDYGDYIHYYSDCLTIQFFIDVRFNGGHFEYLISHKDKWPSQAVPSHDAFSKWPSLLFNFLQAHVNIQVTPSNSVNWLPNEAANPIGEPISITCKLFAYYIACVSRETNLCSVDI